jgi:hypothetical protein
MLTPDRLASFDRESGASTVFSMSFTAACTRGSIFPVLLMSG